ncbi:helicase-associated domain-containing protein [Nocardioides panacisoli]|uniref:Helicase-associated domain-containing protein n=1 Tax=Nocardioides panacisoli TaxID=627624 RepID=A0ABP7IE32_9ACTN
MVQVGRTGNDGAQRSGHRSLADQLRSWPAERVAQLLTDRPDLATPAPHDFGQLASRAASRSSVARAIDILSRGEVSVLDALVVAVETTRTEIAQTVYADPSFVGATVDRLLDLALVWESTEGLRPLSAVADCLTGGTESGVSGLRPRSAENRSVARTAELVASVSPGARRLLEHVVAEGGTATAGSARVGISPGDETSPAEELIAHRLLLPSGDGLLVAPGEVGLAVRGGRTTTTPVDVPPDIAWSERPVRLATSAAAGAAAEAVRHVEQLLEWWGHRPAAALRTGGLGVRELRSAGEHLGLDNGGAALVVETASAAGLVATRADVDGNPVWVPTDAFDSWMELDVAGRWAVLARAWLASPRLPSLVGERGPDGKTWNALTPELSSGVLPETKRMVLTELARAPEGSGLATGTGLASLVARLAWLRPRRPRTRADLAAWAVGEAGRLGLTGLDAVPSYTRDLLAGADPVPALAALLPDPVDHVLIQADLTAVAPGPLLPDIARSLHLVADVESRGAATVYRFTPASIRRALDAGWSAAETHAFLESVSRTPVPQPLSYLVDDAVRSFGRLRVGVAESFVRSDDEAALAELVHHPRAAALGLRRIAPTVLVSTTPPDILLPRLRELGVAPVAEASDGTVRVGVVEPLRARAPKQRVAAAEEARAAAHAAAAVRALEEGEEAARSRPATASSPANALSALRDAIERRADVLIAYTDDRGVVGERTVRPVRVEGGRLTALDPSDGEERSFPVHRIGRVTPSP